MVVLVLLALLGAALPVAAQDVTRPLPRLAVRDDGSSAAARVFEQAALAHVPVLARIDVPVLPATTAVDATLAARTALRIPLWVSVTAPLSEADVEMRWRAELRRLIDRHGPAMAVLEVMVDGVPDRVAAFAVQVAATEVRARHDQVRVAIGGAAMNDAGRRAAIYSGELAPYVDLLSVDAQRAAPAAEWLQRVDPDARVIASNADTALPAPRAQDVVNGVLQDLGTVTVARAWAVADVGPDAIRALSAMSDVLGHDLTILDPDAVRFMLTVNGQDVSRSVPYRLLFDTETFSTLLVYWGSAASDGMLLSLRVPIEGTPAVVDLMGGSKTPVQGYERDPATEQTRAIVPLTGRPMLVNFNEGGAPLAAGTSITAERQLTVAEIISRHQRQQLAQDRLVRHYTADVRMRQSFRPTITDPGYDIVTENRYFVNGDSVEWEELSFAVNNHTFEEENRPPLPMLQPEKVLSLPLQLRFDEGYTYRLAGIERVDGFDCYKVSFAPAKDDASLYKGTVWIDRRTFARVKVHAVKGGLRGVVVSNDETLHYAPVTTIGSQPLFLFSAMEGYQILLMAGRNITVDKSVTFTTFRVNGDDFEEARASAHRSDRTMFRETPGGLRYLVKRDGERVVSDRPTERVKAMAIGAVIDPSYAFPLPIFGINYIDFNFGNPDTQLAMLFAGVLAAGNIQRPHLGSPRLDASVDFFAIAAPSSDRVYQPDGEIDAERVLTWPMSAGLNVGWRATPFQKLTFQYQFRFDAYAHDITTAETFQLPSSTATNGVGGAWEYSRRGYTAVVNGAWFRRGRWEPWGSGGPADAPRPTSRDYTKFSASLSRDFFIDALQKVNVNGAWFGGQRLDRFVKYQFGMFDATRIHGVPAAVRFGELAVARGSYSLNIFNQYRLDLFLDHAWGQEDDGGDWFRVPGIGTAFNLPGPWNTIVRADVGRSWLPARYGRLGSTTAQVMLLKPLK